MRRLIGILAALLATPAFAASIYEVPEVAGEVVGAWDVNILADDVHFETAAFVSKIRMRLAIAGTQTCKLWVFDALNRPPIHETAFTSIPAANEFDVSTYDFDMRLQVPKDIYVGFSAEVGGWGINGVDYWSWGSGVTQGIAGTAGQYYYGTVTGRQLTARYDAGNTSYGCMQILAEPVRIDDVEVATGQVHLTISSLPIYATNAVQQSGSAADTNWAEVETLPVGVSNHVWSATNHGAPSSYYRVITR